MKTLLFVVASALLLPGCPSGDKCDTGDSGDSGCASEEGGPTLLVADGSCTSDDCTWTVQSSGPIESVTLDIIENGDPSFDCTEPTTGQLVCGVWTEQHTAFVLIDSSDTSETKEITLDLVDSFYDQVNNASTLFDLNNSTTANQITVMFTITDESGTYADCATYGYDPSYYAASCTQVLD